MMRPMFTKTQDLPLELWASIASKVPVKVAFLKGPEVVATRLRPEALFGSHYGLLNCTLFNDARRFSKEYGKEYNAQGAN